MSTLYFHQTVVFSMLIQADADYIPKWRTLLDALEKKNEPQSYMFLYDGYRDLWSVQLHAFCKDGGSDETLNQIFDDMMKMLDRSAQFEDNMYDNAGSWVACIQYYMPDPVTKCTPPQCKIYLARLAQVITKMETIEKAYKESGKRFVCVRHHADGD